MMLLWMLVRLRTLGYFCRRARVHEKEPNINSTIAISIPHREVPSRYLCM